MDTLISFFIGDRTQFADEKELAEYATVSILAFSFMILHAAFGAFYYFLDVLPLVYINIGSVLIYLIIVSINARVKGKLSTLFLILEVCLYCMANVLILGWEANTQWFLPFMIFPCFLCFPISAKRAWVYVLVLCSAMVCCYWAYINVLPLYRIDLSPVVFLNLLVCTVGASAVVQFTHLVQRITEYYYREKIQRLISDAVIDPLTGLGNRRYAEEKIQEVLTSGDPASPIIFAMMDLDFFKNVNDTYGHGCGDQVLKVLANQISMRFRKSDIAARWGGEEFLVVLVDTDGETAWQILSNFRSNIEQMPFAVDGKRLCVTVTIGYCECDGNIDASEAIDRSDQALYFGKNNGRNCVVMYSKEGMQIK